MTLVWQEMDTLWRLADHRLVGSRPGDPQQPPLVVAACDDDQLAWATSLDLDADTRAEVERLLSDGPIVRPGATSEPWAPASAAAVLDALGPVGSIGHNVSYVAEHPPEVPDGLEYEFGPGSDPGVPGARMPERDRTTLLAPWAVVIEDGEVAAVCETARSAPHSVEAGVWTYERFRRRGFGRAAVAAWSTLVADRTIFYSTSTDNLASQRIAHSLGLRPLAWWWQVHEVAP